MSEQKTQALTVAKSRNIAPIIPSSTDDITRIAAFMQQAQSLPRSYGTGEDAVRKASIAIMKGLEVGWLPMQAVQNMYVINGIPTIYGDGAVALVRASGLVEELDTWIEGEGDEQVAVCRVKRRGEKPVERTFSKRDAILANLIGKPGPWKQYPQRMMQMRARAFALRDVFADILVGMRIQEEVADYALDETEPTLAVDPFADAPTPPKADESPAKPAEVVQDAEFEDAGPPEGEPEDPPAPPSGAIYGSPSEALGDMQKALATFKTAKDVNEYGAIWADMVRSSFDECDDVLASGRKLIATRKAEIQKGKAA